MEQCRERQNDVLFFVNLFALIAVGTLALGWVLYFTEWFPVIGGLLGLGGLFAWIAFLGNVVADARKTAMQTFVDQRCLPRAWFSAVLGVVAVGLAGYAMAHGSVVLDNQRSDRPRHATIAPAGADGTQTEVVVPARGTVTVPLSTGLFGTRTYRIKLEQLPWLQRPLAFFEAGTVLVDEDFRKRTIVLIRPHAAAVGYLGAAGRSLRVTIGDDGAPLDRPDYRGEAVWLGAAGDVEPVDELRRDWQLELERRFAARPNLAQRHDALWRRPISLTADRLTPGAAITAQVVNDETGAVILQGDLAVPPQASERGALKLALEVPQ